MEHLSSRQLDALRAISDVFVPGQGAEFPSASSLGSEALALELLARNPRRADLRTLRIALELWDRRGLGWLVTGSLRRFSALSAAQRQQIMLRMAQSNLASSRMLFAGLRGAALAPYYMEATATSDSPPAQALDYQPASPPKNPPITPLLDVANVTSDTTIDCDAVVVGSGAGGSVAAGVLATSGLSVVVVEAGGYHHEAGFDSTDKTGIRNLYSGGPLLTTEGQLILMAASCVGGGTVVNYTTCFRTPDHIREEWASHGVSQFVTDEYDVALQAVCDRAGVNLNHTEPSPRDHFMERGLRRLGWPVHPTARNVVGCDMGTVCGQCAMGCPIGAKQSTPRTWLADANKAGARILPNIRVHTITVKNGQASGVIAYTNGGHRIAINARAVVVAAGAIQTPALLKRSGMHNPNIGRHLRTHPAAIVWGRTNYDVKPWSGSMQSRYSDHHANLDGNGYGVLYETAPLTPAMASVLLPWHGGKAHLDTMKELHRTVPLAVIVRDKGSGRVKVDRRGEPLVRYQLSRADASHLMSGLEGAARILEAAGAEKVIAPYHQPIDFEPWRRGSPQSFARECRSAGTKPGSITLASLHLMGSARMGADPRTSATNPDGQSWDISNVVVTDGSCFPTASGVNPMISIQAIAYMNATRLASRLTAN